MTYCVAMRLNAGLVFAADTRTSAGVDYVTSYSKMRCLAPAPDRVFVILSAGNLGITQEVLFGLQRDLDTAAPESLGTVRYLFEAAHYLGRLSQAIQQEHYPALAHSGISGEVSFILGGQIGGEPHGIFLVYPQGNFIHSSAETPYLQIGENKYGKPVLDRLLTEDLSLEQAAKLALVSLDATARSNVTVGLPFEIAGYRGDSLALPRRVEISAECPYYASVGKAWQEGLRDTFNRLPDIDWSQIVTSPSQQDSPWQEASARQPPSQTR